MDFDKFFEIFEEAAATEKRRPLIHHSEEAPAWGEHLVKIISTDKLKTRVGKELFVVYLDVIQSNVHKAGAQVKHMLTLTGVPDYIEQKNTVQLAEMWVATLGKENITREAIMNLRDGKPTEINGKVMLMGITEKVSRNGKSYTEFKYSKANDETAIIEKTEAPPTVAAPKVELAVTSTASASDEDVPFDI